MTLIHTQTHREYNSQCLQLKRGALPNRKSDYHA